MKTLTRSQAIAILRQKCLALVNDEHSLCQVATQRKIMCGGFSQWTFAELKERYDWIVKSRPGITREELEDLANRWQLARQFVHDTSLSCDTQVQEKHHQICQGWDTHTNEELARFVLELTGDEFEVVADPATEREPKPRSPSSGS